MEYLDWIDRWMLAADPTGLLAGEQRHFGASGTHALGFVYVDHECGVTMNVKTFCRLGRGGEVLPTDGPRQHDAALLLRYGTLEALTLTPLADDERKRLGLPSRPEWLAIYRHQNVKSLRRLPLLHPLRAQGYPDDIKFLLLGDGDAQPELVWGRLEGVLGEYYFDCKMLNEPNQDFGLHMGERVMVSVREIEGGVSPICLGPLSNFLDE